eukprot:TRINITY_DN3625_c0_g1_i6.p1 TRINITY_DN3625_c0_g1~~TRINITY_DN3625_c0_g1_i6.p1  ORF type:complete len:258 (+),score=66.15 TRINITY_DN3625_c0_g1_i6:104-877(+)
MSDKKTNSSMHVDLEGTTRSFSPFPSKTSRIELTKRFSRGKRNSLTANLNKSYFRGQVVAEKLAKEEAVTNTSNSITKELIAEFSAKIANLKSSKRTLLTKQKKLCNALQTQYYENKELRAEELRLARLLNDLGMEKADTKEKLKQAHAIFSLIKHKALDQKSEYERDIKKQQELVSELEKKKKSVKMELQHQRYKHKNEMSEILTHKQNLETESRLVRTSLKELEEKKHLAAIAVEKSNSEFKDRIRELSAVLNNA